MKGEKIRVTQLTSWPGVVLLQDDKLHLHVCRYLAKIPTERWEPNQNEASPNLANKDSLLPDWKENIKSNKSPPVGKAS